MAPIVVEYAKSGRAKCSLTSCKRTIVKHEVRVGSVIEMPFGDGAETIKWRHLCCFTARQLQNAKTSGDIENIAGIDDLAPADKALVEQMTRGELVGKTDLIGCVGDIMNSPIASQLAGKGGVPVPKKKAAPLNFGAAAKKAKVEKADEKEDVDSDATEEFEVEVRDMPAKPLCPYGANCFRTAPDHFQQYTHLNHDSEEDGDRAGVPQRRPVLLGAKRARSPASSATTTRII